MQKLDHIDNGNPFDWGKTSQDYQLYRPGYPKAFYEILYKLGIGLKNQRILDMGTGTGELAIQFAKQGSIVTANDISEQQIETAKKNAENNNLSIKFNVAAAEEIIFDENSFDVISASMCWLYFDKQKMIPIIKKLLIDNGLFLVTSMIWLPFEDNTAKKTEDLVLQYNPKWKGAGFTGYYDKKNPVPEWSKNDFYLKSFHTFKTGIPFTHESWRGRIRACRGIGASLPKEEITKFDNEHSKLLKNIIPDKFNVLHLLTISIFELK